MIERPTTSRSVFLVIVLTLVVCAVPVFAGSTVVPTATEATVAVDVPSAGPGELEESLFGPAPLELSTVCKRVHTDPANAGNCESICYAAGCGWGDYDYATCECVCTYDL